MLESIFRKVLRDVFGGGANISAANPLETHDPKVGSLISYEGTTTANGAGGGINLVCSDLTTKPDFDGNLVIITSGAYEGQARDINGVTTGGTVTPSRPFGGLIVSGTKFVIVGITTTPAEVAAIEAKLDHATHGLAALKALIDMIETKADVLGLTTFTQKTAAGVAANGVTPVTLYDGTGIIKPTKICGFRCTKGGAAWAGNSVVWIEDGAGNKIFPFQANYVEGTDFADGAQVVFNFEVVVPVVSGYQVMFKSTAAGDNAGQTLTLDTLDVIEAG